MAREVNRSVGLFAGLALVFTTWAGLTAVVAGRLPGQALVPALAIAELIASAVGLLLARGAKRLPEPRMMAAAAGAGFLGLFLAPYLVLTHRYSDAPSGTELLFFTTACWGAIACLPLALAWWRRGERGRTAAVAAGAATALAGAAGILANWERPSSFSPLVRYAAEEMWMLAAGVAFVAGVVVMRRVLGRAGAVCTVIGAGTATVASLVAWLAAGDPLVSFGRLAEMPGAVALWAIAGVAVWMAWTGREVAAAPQMAACALFLPPALLPLLSLLERAVGLAGPVPLVWEGIAGGMLLMAAGVTRVLTWRPGPSTALATTGRPLALIGAGLLAAVTFASLWLPALRATVTGERPEGPLEMAWDLAGWESVAALAAVALALLLVVTLRDRSIPGAATALAALPAYLLLARTPTHVLTSWVPSDIQVDYGTEYAQISFSALPVWSTRLALGGVGVALALVLVSRLSRSARGAGSKTIPVEE